MNGRNESPAKNRRKNPDYCGKTFLRNVLYVFNLVFFVSIYTRKKLLVRHEKGDQAFSCISLIYVGILHNLLLYKGQTTNSCKLDT